MQQQVKANPWLTREERQALMEKSDYKAVLELVHTWGWIALAFALAGLWPNVFTVLIALWILGGKQLACAIIMHDASHFALFRSKPANNIAGRWLGAYPIFNSLDRYRPYHLEHHVNTGLPDDPDLLLTRGYPTSRKSMLRKFARDLFGITGIKAFIGLMAMHLGFLEYNLGNRVRWTRPKGGGALLRNAWNNLSGPLAANGILFGILWLAAAPWLYLLWLGAYLTTFQVSLRVRSIAEHSVVEDTTDPLRNTRTTNANWLERMLFAPHHVNYHVEHHMLMSVPPYNLPKMHKLLKARGFYEQGGLLARGGYPEIIRLAAGGRTAEA